MPGTPQLSDELTLPELPVVTGPTLQPKRYGAEEYWRVLCQVLEVLPNREVLMARRLHAPGPVAVRFSA